MYATLLAGHLLYFHFRLFLTVKALPKSLMKNVSPSTALVNIIIQFSYQSALNFTVLQVQRFQTHSLLTVLYSSLRAQISRGYHISIPVDLVSVDQETTHHSRGGHLFTDVIHVM